jgi:hypothetical protein
VLPFVALASIASESSARADSADAGYPAACDASKVSRGNVDRAHAVFLSGKQFLEESNYDKAIGYFKDAYSIDCSVHGILPIIATAYERKGDRAAAIGALQEYLRRAPAAPDRDVIGRRIKNLSDQLAREAAPATVPAPAPASTHPPETPAPAAQAPTPVAAPPPAPATTAPSTPSAEPRPEASASGDVLPWIVVGVGGAALATGTILYVLGAKDVSDASKDCPGRTSCAPDVASTGNTGRTLETVGLVAGGVGLAGIAAGLYWHFAQKSREPTSAASPIQLTIAPGYAGVALGGRL